MIFTPKQLSDQDLIKWFIRFKDEAIKREIVQCFTKDDIEEIMIDLEKLAEFYKRDYKGKRYYEGYISGLYKGYAKLKILIDKTP